jgi:hypothetical protein
MAGLPSSAALSASDATGHRSSKGISVTKKLWDAKASKVRRRCLGVWACGRVWWCQGKLAGGLLHLGQCSRAPAPWSCGGWDDCIMLSTACTVPSQCKISQSVLRKHGVMDCALLCVAECRSCCSVWLLKAPAAVYRGCCLQVWRFAPLDDNDPQLLPSDYRYRYEAAAVLEG